MKRFVITMTAGLLLAGTMLPAQEVYARKERQQDRIAQGAANGSLTPKETSRLENKEAALNKEIHHDRKVNGGNLTAKEKKHINRQQNRLSRDIYKQKHDAQHQ